jgi:NAD(P)H-dependent FMN reductase
MKTILAFSGSLSSDSINHRLIEHAAPLTEGVEVRIISLRDFPMPLYSRDIEQEVIPENVKELRALFDAADGFLVSVPEYNSSVPAGFKNAIDWLSRTGGRTFQDKPVLLMSATPGGRGGASVQEHLLKVMPFWGANVVGSFSLPKFNENFVDGKLEGELRANLKDALRNLTEAVG